MIVFKERTIYLSSYTKLAPIEVFSLSPQNEYDAYITDISILKDVPLMVSSMTGLTLYNAVENDAYEQWCEQIIYSDNVLFNIIMKIINAHLNGTAMIIYTYNLYGNNQGLIEMLSKVISNRYGIICWNINVPEDEGIIKDDGTIDPFKIEVLDADVRRYSMILNNV